MIKLALILAATTAHCRLSIQGTFSISSCGVSQRQATCRYNVKPSKHVFLSSTVSRVPRPVLYALVSKKNKKASLENENKQKDGRVLLDA